MPRGWSLADLAIFFLFRPAGRLNALPQYSDMTIAGN